MLRAYAVRLLECEARALLERLREMRPFALTLPMVVAAAPTIAAQTAIETLLSRGRRSLRAAVHGFLRWLSSPAGVQASPAEAQRRFTSIRLRFLSVITQFDVFADALAERSQHGYGDLIAGLDAAAADALALPGNPLDVPPLICHLDRGAGAAIRRIRTRLPGGGVSPVAIIRVPRERMIGTAIAGSLVHEVGHQGAELLDLVGPLHAALGKTAAQAGRSRDAWLCFQRWISEIIADFWSVARIGVAATMGLMGVVSLPAPFVTRLILDDPHPTPWIRVKLSAAFGKAMFPDPQWDRLAAIWESFYPLDSNRVAHAPLLRELDATLPAFVRRILDFRPLRLGGARLGDAFPLSDRSPAQLRRLWTAHRRGDDVFARLAPTVALAVVGQARCDGVVGASAEAGLLRRLLRYWALRDTVRASHVRGMQHEPRPFALAG
ncbi:MAG: hypothetical protein HOP29_07540 [Phycisphaerales bacterium]|nr:hypothetical protein [Phycisphaerales bacterium]